MSSPGVPRAQQECLTTLVSLNHYCAESILKAPELTFVKTATRLVLLAVYAQLDLTADDPAVLAAEDIGVYGRRIAAQFLPAANCPFRDSKSYMVLWETSSIDERSCHEVSYFAGSRVHRRQDATRSLDILEVLVEGRVLLGRESLPRRRCRARGKFIVAHDGNICSSLDVYGKRDIPVRALGSLDVFDLSQTAGALLRLDIPAKIRNAW
jgi:Zn ribbon nucleic-acid-binding protein